MKKIAVIILVIFFASISNGAVYQFQRALEALFVRFDNSTNGFTATNVQAAIEEARITSEGKARYTVSSGFDGTANVGRYLEFNSNVDSNQSGYINANASWIKEISCVCQSSSTITFTIAKVGGGDLASCSIAAARKSVTTGLLVSLISLDELSIRVTSGSCARPIVWVYFQNQ